MDSHSDLLYKICETVTSHMLDLLRKILLEKGKSNFSGKVPLKESTSDIKGWVDNLIVDVLLPSIEKEKLMVTKLAADNIRLRKLTAKMKAKLREKEAELEEKRELAMMIKNSNLKRVRLSSLQISNANIRSEEDISTPNPLETLLEQIDDNIKSEEDISTPNPLETLLEQIDDNIKSEEDISTPDQLDGNIRSEEDTKTFLEQLDGNNRSEDDVKTFLGKLYCSIKSEEDISTPNPLETLLAQIDANVKSKVDWSDFDILAKDCGDDLIKVGRFNFPSPLACTVERIIKTHGDITSDSLQSDCAVTPSYILFGAAIHEMNDLTLEQIDERKILLWRDAINSALNVKFKVKFAIEHLKRIALAYYGLKAIKENEELQNTDGKVRKIEVPEECLQEAEYFGGKPLSTGLFH